MNQYKPYNPTEVSSGTGDVAAVAAATGLVLMAISVRESAGSPAAASLQIHHGDDATGEVVDVIALAASGHVFHSFGPNGISCPDGVFVNRLAGSSHVVLYTVADS